MESTSGIGSVTNTTACNFTTSTSTTILASACTQTGSSMYYYAGDTMMASIAGSQLTAESPDLMPGDSSLVYRYIFARYSGPVPPTAWPAAYAEPANPYTADTYEPDNTCAQATPITVNKHDTAGMALHFSLYGGVPEGLLSGVLI